MLKVDQKSIILDWTIDGYTEFLYFHFVWNENSQVTYIISKIMFYSWIAVTHTPTFLEAIENIFSIEEQFSATGNICCCACDTIDYWSVWVVTFQVEIQMMKLNSFLVKNSLMGNIIIGKCW